MHEYQRRLQKSMALGLTDKMSIGLARVSHDDWCGIYKHADCNCDPNITIKTDRGLVRILPDGTIENCLH